MSIYDIGFEFRRLRWRLWFSPTKDGWSGGGYVLLTASKRYSILCGHAGLWPCSASFDRVSMVSVFMQNKDGGFLHSMGCPSGMTTSSSPFYSKGETRNNLGSSAGCSFMQ